MKRIISSFFCLSFLIMACSSDSSSNSTGNPSSAAANKESASYGIVPIAMDSDSGNSQDPNNDNTNITSSSKTEYRFNSERTVLFENWGNRTSEFIAAYYDEQGIQFTGSDFNAGYMVTYRTMSGDSRNYAAWLWNNSYSHETCESDYALFESECSSHHGEFVNYREGDVCATSQLWLSCVYPLETSVNKSFIDSVAAELHSFVNEHWSTPYPENDSTSSMSASSSSP